MQKDRMTMHAEYGSVCEKALSVNQGLVNCLAIWTIGGSFEAERSSSQLQLTG